MYFQGFYIPSFWFTSENTGSQEFNVIFRNSLADFIMGHRTNCFGWLDLKKKKNTVYIRSLWLWTPTHGRAKAGRPARTYIQQLCEDTGCCPEDLPRAMSDREEWRERVRDIRATSAT